MRPWARILCALGLAGCAHGPILSTPDFAPRLDRELASIADDAQCPLASLSVVAVRGGNVVYEHAFGRRFIDASGSGRDQPAEPATLFRIASISKLVTTLGVMKLVEEGRLSLDEDIGTYLGYRVRNPNFPDVPITLRMLLTHTSSLRDDAGYFWFDGELKDVLVPGGSRFGNGGMWSRTHGPGSHFSYANLPWGVAGTVMEKATGKRFDRLMRSLVIDPLGLQGGYNPAELAPATLANLATLYRKATAGDENIWNPKGPWIAQTDDYSVQPPASRARGDYAIGTNGTLFGPQGGLRASTRDLARIMRMLMNGGEIDGRRVLNRATVDEMLSRQWTRGDANGEPDYGSHRGRFNAWGLGNQQFVDVSGPDYGDRLVEGGGVTAAGHLGDAYGLLGTLAFDRASRNGFAFLIGGTGCDPETQRGAYSAAARFEERIATALHRRAVAGRAD
jgi:CubicO group peptidase (beta-lactamase class C family)